MIPFLIVAALLIIFLFMICPALRRHPDRKVLEGLYIAHRGLHSVNPAIPENSLAAFEAAVETGYAIENDIHLTLDGQVIVFHDDTFKRMCGVDKRPEEMTLEEIKKLRLKNTNQSIPTLKECLDLVDGRVPLMIEVKCPAALDYAPLCRAANEILKDYKGKYFIQSFYPPVLMWYKKHRPDICRGQLASAFYKESIDKRLLGCMIFNFLSRPDFVSYEHTYKNNLFRRLCVLLGAFPVGWTFKKQTDIDSAKKHFKTFIFEKFEAKKPS